MLETKLSEILEIIRRIEALLSVPPEAHTQPLPQVV
jgi:hypothetical protein